MSDDWDHYAMFSGVYPTPRPAWDYFDFVSDGADRHAQLDSGRLPWWTDPELRLSFLRPLSSVSLWADHAIAETSRVALVAHVSSALWWVLGAFAVAGLLGQLLPPVAALLATLLYALDDAAAVPVSWSANRAELLAVALTSGALWAHVVWRRSGLTRHRLAALALAVLAILSGEHALAMAVFLAACELGEPGRALGARLRGATLLITPALAYLVVRAALGYGVTGSMFYSDPIAEPGRFAQALALNVPLLVGDLAFGYSADAWYWGPTWRDSLLELHIVPKTWLEYGTLRDVQHALGLFALCAVVLGWMALVRRATSATARSLCWLLAAAVLALVPLAGALPMSRLTLGPSIAFHAAFACLAVRAWQRVRAAGPLWARAFAALLCALLLGVHGVHAATRSRRIAEHYQRSSRVEERWITRAPALDDPTLSRRHVFVISATDAGTSFSLPFVRRFWGRTAPLTSELLLPSYRGAMWLQRIDRHVIDVWSPSYDGLSDFRRSAYRREEASFAAGQHIEGPRFSVTVVDQQQGVPTRLRFAFARPLEDHRYLFVRATEAGLTPVVLPRPGQVMKLPAPVSPRPL